MRRTLGLVVYFSLLLALPLVAQIAVPYTFAPSTRISSANVNANFSAVGDGALDRTGGTMTGALVTQNVLPDGNNTRDLGVTATRYRDGWFGRDLAVAGAITGSGAGLTAIPETGIADGAVFPRLAANETITGTYTTASGQPQSYFNETDAAADNRSWRTVVDSGTWYLQTWNDANTVNANPLYIVRSGTTISSINLGATTTIVSGSLGVGGGTAVASILTASTTWDPVSRVAAESQNTTLTVTGVQPSSPCVVGFYPKVGGVYASGQVLSAMYYTTDTVSVVMLNASGVTKDIESATLRVTCFNY